MWCNYLNLPKNDNLKGGGKGESCIFKHVRASCKENPTLQTAYCPNQKTD